MTKCAVLQCKNYSNRTADVSFHPFPVDPARKRKWVEAVRREQTWIPTKHHRICSIHFKPEFFNENCKKQRKLVKEAFPTLHLPQFVITCEKEHDLCSYENMELEQNEVPDIKPNNPVGVPRPIRAHNYSETLSVLQTQRLTRKMKEQSRKIKRLQYLNRNLKKKVASLEETLDRVTRKSLVMDEDII